MAGATERLAVIIDAKVDGFVRDIKKAGATAKSSLDDQPVSKFDQKLQGMGISAGVAKTALAAAGAAAAGFAATKLVGFAKDSVDAFTGLASKVRDFQRVSGASAETSSKFVFALDAIGVGADKGATGIFQLGQRIGRGKVDLTEFGVTIARTAKGGVDLTGTFLNIADAYKRTEDPAKRAALVMDAFGRSGKNLIPLLARSRDGIKQLFDEAKNTNQILSQSDLDRARQFQLAVHELGATFEGIKVKAGNAITPFLTDITKMLTSLVQIADKAHVFDAIGIGIAAGIRPLTNMVETLKRFTDEIGLTQNSVDKFSIVQKTLSDDEARYAQLVQEGNGNSKEARDLRSQISGLNGAMASSQDKVNSALQTSADKAKIANDNLNNLKTTLFGFGDAQRAAEGALLHYQDAQQGVIDATDTYNKAVADGKQTNESDAQFQERKAGLLRAVREAQLGAADAQNAVAKSAVDALTSQKAYDAAAGDPKARATLIKQLEDARTKFGDTTGAIGAAILKLQAYNATPIPPKKAEVDTAGAKANVDGLRGAINSITGKTVDIIANVKLFGAEAANATLSTFVNLKKLLGFAGGGRPKVGQPSIVGENGPEIFVPDTAGRVLSHADSIAKLTALGAASNGGTSAPISVNLNFNGIVGDPAAVGREAVRAVQAYERGSGKAWRS